MHKQKLPAPVAGGMAESARLGLPQSYAVSSPRQKAKRQSLVIGIIVEISAGGAIGGLTRITFRGHEKRSECGEGIICPGRIDDCSAAFNLKRRRYTIR